MWQKNVRYLDYNAGSGLSSFVQQKLIETLQNSLASDSLLVNPSSLHRLGQKVQHQLYQASKKIAASLGENVSTDELVFTSSGTESSQTVIRSCFEDANAVIIGAGEHSASHGLLEEARNSKIKFTAELPLLSNGQYDLVKLQNYFAVLKEQGLSVVFLSLFWANNETGALADLVALKKVIDDSGLQVVLHLDGAQVWGKIELNLIQTPAHFITFSAHKIGALAGSGVIWMRKGTSLRPVFRGSQSRGLRAGTENAFGILAMGYAAESMNPQKFIEITGRLQSAFEAGLNESGLPVRIWAQESKRVSNTTRFSMTSFHVYENWVELLDLKGFAVSHGSACKSKVIEPSRVLLNMGASRADALNSIRISFSPSNTIEDVQELIIALKTIHAAKIETIGANP
jgi:cysteine desulfurase